MNENKLGTKVENNYIPEGWIILNFAHPLTSEQISQIEKLSKRKIKKIIDFKVQFNSDESFYPQFENLIRKIDYNIWNFPVLINLPSLNSIAALLIAEFYRQLDYFPPIIRLKGVSDSLTPHFELAEILYI